MAPLNKESSTSFIHITHACIYLTFSLTISVTGLVERNLIKTAKLKLRKSKK